MLYAYKCGRAFQAFSHQASTAEARPSNLQYIGARLGHLHMHTHTHKLEKPLLVSGTGPAQPDVSPPPPLQAVYKATSTAFAYKTYRRLPMGMLLYSRVSRGEG